MHRRVGLIGLLAFAMAMIVVTPTRAGGAVCAATPILGPPGTAFTFLCSGFSKNSVLNVYAVEPDGRALSGSQFSGFFSNLSSSSVLSDNNGTTSFVWQSAGGGIFGFADQLGSWTWVVHELAPGGGVAAEGQATVTLTSKYEPQTGAILTVSPNAGTTFNFTGSGFLDGEIASIWVTLPPNCSGRNNLEGRSVDDPLYQGPTDGFFGANSARADEDGNIAFSLVFQPQACRGSYSATARALFSGRGGEISFRVEGNSLSANAMLATTPNSVTALSPFLTLLGSGFPQGGGVDCWTTRPDGRVFYVGSTVADRSGNFSLRIHASSFDSALPFASEEPGLWYATCALPNQSWVAMTSFLVTGLVTDP